MNTDHTVVPAVMDKIQILSHVHQIEKLHREGNYEDIKSLVEDLEDVPIDAVVLQETGVAKVLYLVLKTCPVASVKNAAKRLLSKWRKLCGKTLPAAGSLCHRNWEARGQAQVWERKGRCRGGNCLASCDGTDGSAPPGEEEEKTSQRKSHMTEKGCDISEQSLRHRVVFPHVTGSDAQSLKDSAEGVLVLDKGGVMMASTVTSQVQNTQGPAETSHNSTTRMSQISDITPLRSKCIQLLIQALRPVETSGVKPASDLRDLALDIEKHIFLLHGQNHLKYKSCIRSKVANLGNLRSPHLRLGLLNRELEPEVFAKMSATEMASPELKELRAKYTKSAILEHQRPLGLEGTPTNKVRCKRCDGCDCRVTQISRGALFLPGWVRQGNIDEDTMTFMTCASCGEQWYHSNWVCL